MLNQNGTTQANFSFEKNNSLLQQENTQQPPINLNTERISTHCYQIKNKFTQVAIIKDFETVNT